MPEPIAFILETPGFAALRRAPQDGAPDVVGSTGRLAPQKQSLHHHQPMHRQQRGEQGGEDEAGEEARQQAELEAALAGEPGEREFAIGFGARGPGGGVGRAPALAVEGGEIPGDLQQQLHVVRRRRVQLGADAVEHGGGGEAVGRGRGLIRICHGALPAELNSANYASARRLIRRRW